MSRTMLTLAWCACAWVSADAGANAGTGTGAAAVSGSLSMPPCRSDDDCSLNGVCDTTSGVCACDAPWSGSSPANTLPDCALLDFTPSPVNDCGPACVFHGVTNSWTSWGMSIVRDGGELHGYVAEMANQCGLNAWTRGSQVVHATSTSPTAQFTRVDIVVEPLSHNPQAITAPDGTIVIYTLFDGWAQNGPPNNCTGAQTRAESMLHRLDPAASAPSPSSTGVGNCTVVTSPSNCNPGPCWSCNITLHYASAVDAAGPWTPHSTQIIGLSNADNIGNYNPAPLVLPNGSIALMVHTDDNQGWSGDVIAVADSWRGPYFVTVPDDAINNEPKKQEDPFMWRDRRGNWHTLVHLMFDPPGAGPCGLWSGGHMFSRDGTSWSPIFRAYNTTVALDGGGSVTFQRRERPKLIFDANGTPTHLYNGVISDNNGVYTIVAPLRV